MPTFRGHQFQEPCWGAKVSGLVSSRYWLDMKRDVSHSLLCGGRGGSSKVLGMSVATKNDIYPFPISLV